MKSDLWQPIASQGVEAASVVSNHSGLFIRVELTLNNRTVPIGTVLWNTVSRGAKSETTANVSLDARHARIVHGTCDSRKYCKSLGAGNRVII